jgi:hypothetical protein
VKKAVILVAFVTSALALVLVTVGQVSVAIRLPEQIGPSPPLGIGAVFVIMFLALFVLGLAVGGVGWLAYHLWRKHFGQGDRG